MKKHLRMIAILVIANATALVIAALYLGPGFRIGISSFLVAVLIFTAVEAAANPLLARASKQWAPRLTGGLSLFAVFISLIVTSLIVPDKMIAGLANWLAATLIVWLISLGAQLALERWVFPAPPGEGEGAQGKE